MDIPLRVLIIEDTDRDVALEVRALEAAGYRVTYTVADSADEMKAALAWQTFDIVISDHDLPQFNAPGALTVLKQSGQEIPFIIVSGAIGEETAVALMKAGAHDYVMKNNLARLVPAIQRELREAESRREHKRADEALLSSEQKYRALLENASDAIMIVDSDGNFLEINKKAEELLGYTREEMLGLSVSQVHPKEELERALHAFSEIVEGKIDFLADIKVFRKDGKIVPVDITGKVIEYEGKRVVQGIFRDITERKRVEEKLQGQFELITTLLDTIPSPIFYKDTSGVYQGCNRAWEEFFGMSKENIIGKTVYDVEPAEIADKYKAMDQELFDRPGMQTYEWKAKAADGSEKEIIFNKATFKDSSGCVAGLVGVMIDITSRKLAEEELRQTMEKLRKSLIGTIQAMSLMVEARDPYTAGHQRKVSSLACAVAQEMGLSNDTVDTIRMAGTIHDIGKISVPAEILSKPGILTNIEMSLIKVHSQSGYDILKDVGLPYPMVEIILQHHERLDGSGYPKGLKDGQILLESQIISVADVVEAISSHRPYRPARGIDAALEEIEKNADVLYYREVVEACLKLFKEGGFKFE